MQLVGTRFERDLYMLCKRDKLPETIDKRKWKGRGQEDFFTCTQVQIILNMLSKMKG